MRGFGFVRFSKIFLFHAGRRKGPKGGCEGMGTALSPLPTEARQTAAAAAAAAAVATAARCSQGTIVV